MLAVFHADGVPGASLRDALVRLLATVNWHTEPVTVESIAGKVVWTTAGAGDLYAIDDMVWLIGASEADLPSTLQALP